jgi:hypothetical protein
MLMTSEKDLLDNITVHDIIAILAKGSSVLPQIKSFYCSLTIFIYL